MDGMALPSTVNCPRQQEHSFDTIVHLPLVVHVQRYRICGVRRQCNATTHSISEISRIDRLDTEFSLCVLAATFSQIRHKSTARRTALSASLNAVRQPNCEFACINDNVGSEA